MDGLISRQDAIDAVIKRAANCEIDSAEVLRALPSAQPDTYEALRILDAINSSGRLDYGDYCDLYDAISEIGGAQNE